MDTDDAGTRGVCNGGVSDKRCHKRRVSARRKNAAQIFPFGGAKLYFI